MRCRSFILVFDNFMEVGQGQTQRKREREREREGKNGEFNRITSRRAGLGYFLHFSSAGDFYNDLHFPFVQSGCGSQDLCSSAAAGNEIFLSKSQ